MKLDVIDKRVGTSKLFKVFGYTEHRGLKKVIHENLDQFNSVSEVRTVTIDSPGRLGGRPTEEYMLDMNHLMLLASIAKNTKGSIKIDLTKYLVKCFFNSNLLSIINLIASFDMSEIDNDKFVYVANEVDTGNYKIGISSDPERRVKELNTGNSSEIKLIHCYLATDDKHKSETLAHAIFEEDRIRGEWFGSGIDISKLPSYSAVCKSSGDCDCFDCTEHSNAYDFVSEDMNRDEAIHAVVQGLGITVERAIKSVDEFIDLGVIGKSQVHSLTLENKGE